MSLVSIIIATYNRDFCIGDAVKSALNQTCKDIEVIVVNDGATDSTEQVVRQIQDPRLFYYYKLHSGLSASRNHGIRLAKGEYIAFLDDDDIYPVDYLEVMINHLRQNSQAGFAYSQFTNIYQDGKQRIGIPNNRALSGRLVSSFFERNSPCMIPSVSVIRKSVMKDIWFDENLSKTEDLDFFLRLSVKTQFLFVPEMTVNRNATSGSLSSEYNLNEMLLYPMILERFCRTDDFSNCELSINKAKRKISNLYRRSAKAQRLAGNRRAALVLAVRAICYVPWNVSYWREGIRSFFLNPKRDKIPDFQLPAPLSMEININETK